MENLTKDQKGKIGFEFIKEHLHEAATLLLFSLGKEAKKLGASITYSVASKYSKNPTVYRMHVSTVDSKERMDDEYFIDIEFYPPQNNLEKMLEEEFKKHQHSIISYAQIPDLKTTYESIVDKYKKNKGRAKVEFHISDYKENIKRIQIGEGIYLSLTKVTGEFWTVATNRKEEQL